MIAVSPCRGCHNEFVDKRCRECVECDKRCAYVTAIGGMTHSMPESGERGAGSREHGPAAALAGYAAVNKYREEMAMTETQEKYTSAGSGAVLTKICSHKDCEHGGRHQNLLDDFDKFSKSKDGRTGFCKSCRRRMQRVLWRGKQAKNAGEKVIKEVKLSSANTSEIIIPADPAPSEDFAAASDEYLLTLDFSGFQGVLEKIKTMAEDELRTPENQVLYWLKGFSRFNENEVELPTNETRPQGKHESGK